jgi:hypothetical protein
MRTNTFLSLALLVVAGGALAGCGEEPIPVNVSYATDIKPLMEARCIRCHGGGGTLNKEPGLPAWFIAKFTSDTPKTSDFTTYAGTKMFAPLFKLYLVPSPADPTTTPPIPALPYLMPPLPSPPLTSREKEMLLEWAAGNPPNP